MELAELSSWVGLGMLFFLFHYHNSVPACVSSLLLPSPSLTAYFFFFTSTFTFLGCDVVVG